LIKSKRNSTIYTDSRGISYYQTYSLEKSNDGRKKKSQKYLGKVKTKSELQRIKVEWDLYYDDVDKQYSSKNPFRKPPQPITTISERFISDCESKYKLNDMSYSTLRFNRENVNLFVRWYVNEYGNKQIHRITTKEIDEYRTHRINMGLMDNTISINLRSVRTFLNWCIKQNYIDLTPFTSDIKIPSYKSRSVDDVPMKDDWKRIYDFIEKSISFKPTKSEDKRKYDWFNNNEWFKYMVWIMCNSGCRGGEVRILKWKKGKFDNPSQSRSYSYLNREMDMIHIYFKKSYGTLPLNKNLQSLFKKLSKDKGNDVYVFQNPKTDEHYERSVFNKLFRRLMVNLGLVDDEQKSKYSPHSIRHSVVSDLLGKGENLYTISKILRHSDIRTTINIYGHLLKEDVLESLEKIGT